MAAAARNEFSKTLGVTFHRGTRPFVCAATISRDTFPPPADDREMLQPRRQLRDHESGCRGRLPRSSRAPWGRHRRRRGGGEQPRGAQSVLGGGRGAQRGGDHRLTSHRVTPPSPRRLQQTGEARPPVLP